MARALIAAMEEAAAHAQGKGEVARIHHLQKLQVTGLIERLRNPRRGNREAWALCSEAADALEKLIAAAIQRDGGAHDIDCKIHRQSVRHCNCGHDALTALLGELGAVAMTPAQQEKDR